MSPGCLAIWFKATQIYYSVQLLEKLGTILSSKKLKRPSPDTRQARGEADAGVIVDTERRFSKKETNASDGGVKVRFIYHSAS